MRLYMAGQYAKRNELRIIARHLQENGFVITSRWLTENAEVNHKLGDPNEGEMDLPTFYLRTAIVDCEDIQTADAILFFAEDPHIGIPRGGRHVEFGYALGIGKRLFVIGAQENIFHYLPNVLVFPSIECFIEHWRTR